MNILYINYNIYIYHGPQKPTCLEVFMVNILVLRWPKPLFFMVKRGLIINLMVTHGYIIDQTIHPPNFQIAFIPMGCRLVAKSKKGTWRMGPQDLEGRG